MDTEQEIACNCQSARFLTEYKTSGLVALGNGQEKQLKILNLGRFDHRLRVGAHTLIDMPPASALALVTFGIKSVGNAGG